NVAFELRPLPIGLRRARLGPRLSHQRKHHQPCNSHRGSRRASPHFCPPRNSTARILPHPPRAGTPENHLFHSEKRAKKNERPATSRPLILQFFFRTYRPGLAAFFFAMPIIFTEVT